MDSVLEAVGPGHAPGSPAASYRGQLCDAQTSGRPPVGAAASAVSHAFYPKDSSWLNLIERWFRDLTTRRLRRGAFRHVMELIAAIEQYIAHHNTRPRVFTWVAKVEEILAKIRRARIALHQTASV